jgi:DNA polymerase III delta prime subunit
MQQHAFVIEADVEQGIEVAEAWARKELGMTLEQNPDISILRYGLFSVADARKVAEVVAGAPFVGEHKVVIIAASRAYHEAQNALLKIFEEPPEGTYLFLILPTLGGLLPTLRSRVQILAATAVPTAAAEIVRDFLAAGKEKRSAIIKKLATGKDDEEKREHREEAIMLVNGLEAALLHAGLEKHKDTLADIAALRGHLYDRSAPVKMILEHLSLVIPSNLL